MTITVNNTDLYEKKYQLLPSKCGGFIKYDKFDILKRYQKMPYFRKFASLKINIILISIYSKC